MHSEIFNLQSSSELFFNKNSILKFPQLLQPEDGAQKLVLCEVLPLADLSTVVDCQAALAPQLGEPGTGGEEPALLPADVAQQGADDLSGAPAQV